MSFEAQLKTNYADAHRRLLNGQAKPAPIIDPPEQLSPPTTPQRVLAIRDLVSRKTGISIERMRNASRKQRPVTDARQIFYFLCHYYTRASLKQIGLGVGGKDHTTVLHGVRAVQHLITTDRWWKGWIEEFSAEIEDSGDNLGKFKLTHKCPFCHGNICPS